MMLLISHWLFLLWASLRIFRFSLPAFSEEVDSCYVMLIFLKQERLVSGETPPG